MSDFLAFVLGFGLLTTFAFCALVANYWAVMAGLY